MLREAGGVATWPGEVFDNALPDWINGLRKHNGNAGGGLLQ
jgi:hypothetical protein